MNIKMCVCVLVCSDGDCGYDMFETDSEEEEEEVKDMTENNIIPKKKTAFQVKGLGGGVFIHLHLYMYYSHTIHSYLNYSQHFSLLLSLISHSHHPLSIVTHILAH